MIDDINSVKYKVAKVLEKAPSTRDCDKLLWLAYMVNFHGLRAKLGDVAYFTLKGILTSPECPSQESIRRVRQKYQESGMYKGTANVKRKRKDEEVLVSDWAKEWKI